MNKRRIFKIKPSIQTYAWGGNHFIPELIRGEVNPKLTYAELWMGDHPKSPAQIPNYFDAIDLHALIQSEPETFLGRESITKFGLRLPFLFKVLDVNKMLSIQTHPNKQEAEAGFNNENLLGIPIESFNRIFKDDNHKPELMIALSPFWLLHGIRPVTEIRSILRSVKALEFLESPLDQGVNKVLEYILRSPEDIFVKVLHDLNLEILKMHELDRSSPHYWVKKAFEEHGLDRGLLFIYLLNLVHLKPGQGIFQAAGIPHAYLEGKNVEIMANSDNVLRGGLTKKYTNIDLLMEHLSMDSVEPQIITGRREKFGIHYPAPVDDFSLFKVRGEGILSKFDGASILLVYSGKGYVKNEISLEITQGDVIFISPQEVFTMEGQFSGFFATSII